MMKVKLWGTRGSVAAPGPAKTRYGGNTSCVEISGSDGTVLILDAGTGLIELSRTLPSNLRQVHLLLTHLHMDHIQGMGFFPPFFNQDIEVNVWGPASTTLSLRARLTRYMSPPLFPVSLRDLPCKLSLHEVPCKDFKIGQFQIFSDLICHAGPTVGYRIQSSDSVVTYLPDHEPALGIKNFPLSRDWTSGYGLAAGADLLIHDAQFSDNEYQHRAGWGHSSINDALKFAALSEVKQLALFHHDPTHSDDDLDRLISEAVKSEKPSFEVTPGTEGAVFRVG
jgi:phosphoribosyl 1,2-cyclic phosphodiesterase